MSTGGLFKNEVEGLISPYLLNMKHGRSIKEAAEVGTYGNLYTQQPEAERSRVQGQPGCRVRPCLEGGREKGVRGRERMHGQNNKRQ